MSDELRRISNAIRWKSLVAIYAARSGHPGGCLSAADLIAHLCRKELAWGQEQSRQQQHFVLSKGHCCPALYAAAAEMGVIPNHLLLTLRKLGSPLQGHPHVLSAPWVENSTGSLGQGFSFSIGMALGLRYRRKSGSVFVMLGDGELQEGEIWEGALCAGHYRLSNLCAVIDYNKMQSDDFNENVIGLEPLAEKWRAFRWQVLEIDGHDFSEISAAFEEACKQEEQPSVILAHTVKGKGVSFMEGSAVWHGSVQIRDQELETALRDLGLPSADIERCLNGTVWRGRC